MSKATLAVILSRLENFTTPSMTLEQYPTPSEIAAEILWDAHLQGLINDKKVLDICAGNGIFGIGSLLLGAKDVLFVDIDPACTDIITRNIHSLQEEFNFSGRWNILTKDATTPLGIQGDIVFTNPPFGTKLEHADTLILEQVSNQAPHIYSFHKATTKHHIIMFMNTLGFEVKNTFSTTFQLKPSMKQHQKKSHPVEVNCWHFSSTKDL